MKYQIQQNDQLNKASSWKQNNQENSLQQVETEKKKNTES